MPPQPRKVSLVAFHLSKETVEKRFWEESKHCVQKDRMLLEFYVYCQILQGKFVETRNNSYVHLISRDHPTGQCFDDEGHLAQSFLVHLRRCFRSNTTKTYLYITRETFWYASKEQSEFASLVSGTDVQDQVLHTKISLFLTQGLGKRSKITKFISLSKNEELHR